MRWWCSGEAAVPWTWTPEPYIGIWLLMLGLASGYVLAMRWYARQPGGRPPTRHQVLAFGGAWLLLWATTDWPVGKLSAGYLLSANMLQIMLYTYVVAPLLVSATPRGLRERMLAAPRLGFLAAVVRRPMVTFVTFNAALVVTHIPSVADLLKASEVGTMVMDVVWLTTGVLFWWSLEVFRSSNSSMRFVKKALYILGTAPAPMLLGIFLTFHNFPLYTTYEFANRVWPTFTALDDQQVAGLLSWVGMMPVIMIRLGLVFREAYLADREGVIAGTDAMLATPGGDRRA
ncbi:MAG: cytochrome c oxidase assembly protein [Dehalococcoidia bacterium]|nr:cytochrome c oxidase assembly protein [Dehalococcoidia bacterium]